MRRGTVVLAVVLAGCSGAGRPGEMTMLEFNAQRRDGLPGIDAVQWDSRQTALVIVDMWDDHWCKGASRRVAELARPLDAFAREARRRGVFVIHAPSTTVGFYQGTPARRRAIEAPFSAPPAPLTTDTRWGTGWCWPDKAREPDLPIDDSDMGCDCEPKCALGDPWKRQIDTIAVDAADAVTDSGQEAWNLMAARGIKNVIVCGVHLNMCVLGRPFAIRQLVRFGLKVVLVRDLTDTMYNSRMRPKVDHHTGTDLVVEHIEKYWCPSIASSELVGGKPFRFSDDRR